MNSEVLCQLVGLVRAAKGFEPDPETDRLIKAGLSPAPPAGITEDILRQKAAYAPGPAEGLPLDLEALAFQDPSVRLYKLRLISCLSLWGRRKGEAPPAERAFIRRCLEILPEAADEEVLAAMCSRLAAMCEGEGSDSLTRQCFT